MSLAATQLCGFMANETFTPAHVSGLVLWLRGDRGLFTDTAGTTPVATAGDAVALWKDQSGLGNNYSQSTSGNRPAWQTSVVNSQHIVRFDGSNDTLTGPSFSSLTAGEIFAVVKNDTDPPVIAKSGLWEFGTDANPSHYPFTDSIIYDSFGTTARKKTVNPAPALTSPRLYNVVSRSGEWTSFLDGTQIFTTATNTVGFPTTTYIGSNPTPDRFLDGDIAEVILYNKKLSAAEKTNVKAYIAARYGLTIA